MNVELRNVHKRFGSVQANAGISLSVHGGTIQGILGENGAGKSTLMKILSGFIRADAGEIFLDGKPASIGSPADALRCGVGMLHQDPLDFPPMRVIDNLLAGQGGSLFPRRKAAARELGELQRKFGFTLDPEAWVESLTVGERQQLEILRLLWLGARVLVLDEPTTGISALQKEKLFAALRVLAEQGRTVIFVSHKLEDVRQLCHRVAVLRKGEGVGEVGPPYSMDGLIKMMFGKSITPRHHKLAGLGEAVLDLDGLALEDPRLRVRSPNLQVRGGEVIGLAGMEGSGQALLLRACAGLVRPVAGRVRLGRKDLTGKWHLAFREHGVAFVPAARLEEGLVPGLTISEHFMIVEPSSGAFIDWSRAAMLARDRIAEYSIRGEPASRVEQLSGGNQQRALLSLLRSPLRLVLLEHPTRGLDVESAMDVWGKLKERCRQGTAILFTSSDLDEILEYSDRILVFFSGRVSGPLEASKTNVDELGQLIGGKT
ncbi:MAG: ATP-binding cassette domain-containing protein [Verrucomicrobiota bacterium]